MVFAFDDRLAADTVFIGNLSICSVLFVNNHHFPWLILVPRREHLCELFDLEHSDYQTCMREVREVAEKFKTLTGADKINIAALGNQVAQLHIHLIARFNTDAAWPNPVWNCGVTPEPYAPAALAEMTGKLKKMLGIARK